MIENIPYHPIIYISVDISTVKIEIGNGNSWGVRQFLSTLNLNHGPPKLGGGALGGGVEGRGVNILKKCQLFNSYGLEVKVF